MNQSPAAALALEIASCSEVQIALNDSSHPCNGVVTWQSKQWIPTITTITTAISKNVFVRLILVSHVLEGSFVI